MTAVSQAARLHLGRKTCMLPAVLGRLSTLVDIELEREGGRNVD